MQSAICCFVLLSLLSMMLHSQMSMLLSCCTLILPSFLGALCYSFVPSGANSCISICELEPHPILRSQTVLFISIVSQLIYRYGPRAQHSCQAKMLIILPPAVFSPD